MKRVLELVFLVVAALLIWSLVIDVPIWDWFRR